MKQPLIAVTDSAHVHRCSHGADLSNINKSSLVGS